MVIGILSLEFYVDFSMSLKEKRQYVRSIKDKIQNNFKVSVAEVDFQDSIKKIKIGISIVSSDKIYVNEVISNIENFTKRNWPDLFYEIKSEIIHLDI